MQNCGNSSRPLKWIPESLTDIGLQLSLTYPYISFSNVYTSTTLEGFQQSLFDTLQTEGYIDLGFLIHCHQDGVFTE